MTRARYTKEESVMNNCLKSLRYLFNETYVSNQSQTYTTLNGNIDKTYRTVHVKTTVLPKFIQLIRENPYVYIEMLPMLESDKSVQDKTRYVKNIMSTHGLDISVSSIRERIIADYC